jgi:hypothetical protein
MEFLSAILFTHSTKQFSVTSEAESYLRSLGAKIITTHHTNDDENQVASGPYYYAKEKLHAVWKLYEDTHGAFLHTLIINTNGQVLQDT